MKLVETLVTNAPVRPAPSLFTIEKAGPVKDLEMVTDGWLRQRNMIFEVTCAKRLTGTSDQKQHRQPVRVAQCFESRGDVTSDRRVDRIVLSPPGNRLGRELSFSKRIRHGA